MIFVVLVVLAADPCASCHPAQAATFSTSRHARAAEWPIFERSFAETRNPWCLTCHQPEGPRTAGHACRTCHQGHAPDAVLNTRSSERGRAQHPVEEQPAFPLDACARCHDFNAPLPHHLNPVVLSNEPLQSTATEQRATLPAKTCVTCHDPHSARGGHDRVTLTRAVSISVNRVEDHVELTVQVSRTGHRFPTGDPFRRLVLETCNDASCTDVVSRKTLQRAMGERDGVWKALTDSTLASEERRVFVLDAAPYWRARYLYGDARFEAQLPSDEVSVTLGEGALP